MKEEKETNDSIDLMLSQNNYNPLNTSDEHVQTEPNIKKCFVQSEFQIKVIEQNKSAIYSLIKISFFCLIFMLIEFIGGEWCGSVAILTISAHLLTDLVKFLITMISLIIIIKPANATMTYGYHRSEIIGNLSSVFIIWVLTIWLIIIAVKDITTPIPIYGVPMIIFAFSGLLFNIIMRYLEGFYPVPNSTDGKFIQNYKEEKTDDKKQPLLEDYLGLNENEDENKIREKIAKKELEKIEKTSKIHLIIDMIQSSIIILSSIFITFLQVSYPWIKILDSICAFTFALSVVITTIPTTKDCINVLMEAAPEEIDANALYQELLNVFGVINIHDIHIWCISVGKPSISLHILSDAPQKTLEGATKICKKYGIMHCTIQVEDNNDERRLSFLRCEHVEENEIH